jgi:hypothetical protein
VLPAGSVVEPSVVELPAFEVVVDGDDASVELHPTVRVRARRKPSHRSCSSAVRRHEVQHGARV